MLVTLRRMHEWDTIPFHDEKIWSKTTRSVPTVKGWTWVTKLHGTEITSEWQRGEKHFKCLTAYKWLAEGERVRFLLHEGRDDLVFRLWTKLCLWLRNNAWENMGIWTATHVMFMCIMGQIQILHQSINQSNFICKAHIHKPQFVS